MAWHAILLDFQSVRPAGGEFRVTETLPRRVVLPSDGVGIWTSDAVCAVAIVIVAISANTASTKIMRLNALPAAIVVCYCAIILVSFVRMGLLYTPTLAGMGSRVIALKD